MRNLESLEQRAFVQWCRLHPLACRIFAIPNGGKRSIITASVLKAEGVVAGVPDLMLPVPIAGVHGLWVEMKAGKGAVSAAQRDMMWWLEAQGYACVVAFGAGPAIEATQQYLSGDLGPGYYVRRGGAPQTVA